MLATAVTARLPEIFCKLWVVGGESHWHEIPGFDWDVGELELRRIEAAALSEDCLSAPADREETALARNRPRITAKEANLRAREALKNPKVRTARRLARAIGCPLGMVPNLPAWQALQLKLKEGKLPPSPKVVSLTPGVLANEGRQDDKLERLIAEQQADFEESPLVSHARKRRASRRPL